MLNVDETSLVQAIVTGRVAMQKYTNHEVHWLSEERQKQKFASFSFWEIYDPGRILSTTE